MADNYIPGDHYLICDRTGFKIRASEAKREWTGAIVRRQSWEARHPQDFVRGRKDNPAVSPDMHRPQGVPQFIGMLSSVIVGDYPAGTLTIEVDTSARYYPGDRITVALSNGDMWPTIVQSVPDGSHLTFNSASPESISSGGSVLNTSAVAPPTIG